MAMRIRPRAFFDRRQMLAAFAALPVLSFARSRREGKGLGFGELYKSFSLCSGWSFPTR